MARIFTENFEGGTVGGTLQGNTAFSVEPATGAVFVSAPVAAGTRAAELSTPATAANRTLNYNLGALRSLLHTAVYYRLAANPAANLFLGGVNAAGVLRASWRINPDGTVSMRNGNTAVWTSTQTVPLNTYVRFEWRVNATALEQQMRVYSGHSATPLFDSGAQTYDQGTFDTFQAGITTAVANQTVNIDWAALDDATWVGPAVASAVPVSSFTASPTSGTAPLAVSFADTSAGGATSWAWSFGDGTTSTAQNPSKTYSTPGSYTVTLTASNASGAGQAATQTINVTATPTVGGMKAFVLNGGAWVAANPFIAVA